MDWNRVEGNWKQVKGKVKEKWGKLTDDDLDVINGRRDQLEGKFRSAMALPRIRSAKTSTIGTLPNAGRNWSKPTEQEALLLARAIARMSKR